MGQTTDIGVRVELVSMDSHCDDISIGLYRQDLAQGPTYRLHTYSQIDGSVDRLAFLSSAMENMAGMQVDSDGGLYFNCGHAHQQAVKRAFLDVCKLPTASAAPEPRQLHIDDKKSGTVIHATHKGNGRYQVSAAEPIEEQARRCAAFARGLMKLGELREVEDLSDSIEFDCQQQHDALIGLLLVRAPNVRAALREAEMMASRGVLSAPSNN